MKGIIANNSKKWYPYRVLFFYISNMYFIKQIKKQFINNIVNYNLETSTASEVEDTQTIMNVADILKKTDKLGINIAKIKEDLQGLQNESEKNQKTDKAEEILKRVETLKEFEEKVGWEISFLNSWLSRLEEEENKKNPDGIDNIFQDSEEISSIRENILRYKQEYNEYVEESDALQRTLETLAQNQLDAKEQEQFQKIKNIDFLKMPTEARLRFLTVGNITSEAVSSGKNKNLEFTFTYDGVFNRDLYIRTTAGQVLPDAVREVTSWTEVFIRKGLNGEFFTQSGKRLKIHERTKIDISKTATTDELKNIQEGFQESLKNYENSAEKDIAQVALEKGIDPKFSILMYGKDIKNLSWESRKAAIEDKLTDIARFQDDFSDTYPKEEVFKDGIVTEAFAGYVVNILNGDINALVKEYGFDADKMNSFKKALRYKSGWALNMENVDIEGVSQVEINRILQLKRFIPGSKEAQVLFTVAAQSAGLPKSWGTHAWLHRILSKESNGIVGRLNYTIPKSYSPERFKELSLSRRNNNPIWVKSTASGLGQLLLSNVDKYYPDGRSGLWDPLNEAVGMLRYIHDRYGSVDVASDVYWKKTSYTHAVTWAHRRKDFREWY